MDLNNDSNYGDTCTSKRTRPSFIDLQNHEGDATARGSTGKKRKTGSAFIPLAEVMEKGNRSLVDVLERVNHTQMEMEEKRSKTATAMMKKQLAYLKIRDTNTNNMLANMTTSFCQALTGVKVTGAPPLIYVPDSPKDDDMEHELLPTHD